MSFKVNSIVQHEKNTKESPLFVEDVLFPCLNLNQPTSHA